MEGKIVKLISNDYTVKSNNTLYICKARGKFRNLNISPMVGDNVIFDEKQKYIMDILPRKNALKRPVVANIDQALILVSVKNPDLDLNLLDKLLCIIEYNNVMPLICFTKLDLLTDLKSIDEIANYYKKIGYKVFYNNDISILKNIFENKITVFTGQSGAGKSTLLNKINEQLNLKTGEISLALGRGKHTTRHVELIEILGGMCADTPGFSAIDLSEMSHADIRDNMIEFNEYKENCQYRDCMHVKEPNCGIKDNSNILQSRYENYLKFIGK